ncbi:hypothetical protein AAG570_009487, partial [Ranatra chinensis]
LLFNSFYLYICSFLTNIRKISDCDFCFFQESESIERLHINASDAFSKFKDKSLSSTNIDFSDRLSKHRRIGYDARSGVWELAGSEDKETPLQRYQRLQCEMKELLEDISAIKVMEDGMKEESQVAMASHVESMLKHLEDLRLEKSLGTEVIGNLTDPQGAQLKKLLSQLENLSSVKQKQNSDGSKGKTIEVGQEGEVRYQVNAKPSNAQLVQAARIAELEAKINRLNSLISTTPSSVRRMGGGDRSLIETARWVAGKTALLDQSQLEAAEARISNLLTKLDQIAERSAQITGNRNTEQDNKISELYELAKTTEDMSQVLPRALERMLALETLHQQGTEFAKSLSELESLQRVLTASCESNKEMLQRLEENFSSNLVALKSNIESLDSRLKALDKKSKK